MQEGIYFVISLFLQGAMFAAASTTIQTNSGVVIGSRHCHGGKFFNRFLGIPFAEPPVGDLRFRKTVSVKPWSKPLVADVMPQACMQFYPYDYPWVDRLPGKSEDCLYLNIWAPEDLSGGPKAVMFWIYGGGFSSGSNRLPTYDGYLLALEGDVVVVTVNYRLEVFGFLSSGDEVAPGNMGLFDIKEALHWIHQNIEAFGGDKDRITVFGQSAGSVSTNFIAVSPLTRGLFKRLIMESGDEVSVHGNIINKNMRLGGKVAEAVGCATDNFTLESHPRQVVKCLRTIDAEALLTAISHIKGSSVNTFLPIYGDQFLPEKPFDALKRGDFQDADILIGNVQDEGSFVLTSKFPEVFGPYGERNPQINKTFGRDIVLKVLKDVENPREIADHYLLGLDEYDFEDVRSQVYHAIGDVNYFCPDLYSAEIFSGRGNNVFFYYFSHQTEATVFADWMGVYHSTEVPFIFGRPVDCPLMYSEDEILLSKRMMQLWSNFAKYGFPSKFWKKFSKYNRQVKRLQVNPKYDNYIVQNFFNCEFLRKWYF